MSGKIQAQPVAKVFCSECHSFLFDVMDYGLRIKAHHHGELHTTEVMFRDLLSSEQLLDNAGDRRVVSYRTTE